MLLPLALLSALYFKTSDGNIYHTIDKIPDGMCILNNNGEVEVFNAENCNTCYKIVLQPGCYRAELRGGIGLQNKYCTDVMEQYFTPTISAIFSINEPTTVYVLRGGDGMPGGVNFSVDNKYTGAFGGGASGVDSILVVGDRVWRASGGAGVGCAATQYTASNQAVKGTLLGNGIGGNSFDDTSYEQQERVYQIQYNTRIYATAGGGGASPNGAGGTDWQVRNAFINADVEYVNPGTNGTNGTNCPNGTGECGGNGGDIKVCNNTSCTSYVEATGGKGGATIKYECGGQTAKTYGGGGGGGAHSSLLSATADGGDGGSGSTDHSDTSFVRIYKM